MRRPFAAATIAAVLVLQALPASALSSGRVVLVTIDGTRLADWTSAALPALSDLMQNGAAGLLSTRAAANPVDIASMRRLAYRTLGAGRISRSADPRSLFRALDGASAAVIAPLGDPAALLSVAQLRMPLRQDRAFPTGSRTALIAARTVVEGALDSSRVVVVELDDTARVEQIYGADPARRAQWMALAMERADSFIGWVRSRLTRNDTLIVASLTPTQERQRERRFLSVVAATGRGMRPGVLTSATTERDGVVTTADITATVLRLMDAPIPAAMTGRPVRVVSEANAVGSVRNLEHDFVHVSVVRGPLLRGGVVAASALVVLSLLTVLAGRGRGGRARGIPLTWRGFLEAGLVAVVALPLTLLAEPLFGTATLAATAFAVSGASLGIALITRTVAGARVAIGGLLSVTAAVILGDLAAGGPLAGRSPLSYLIAEGARFHGIGNEAMGVLVAAALLAVAWILDRRAGARRVGVAAVVLAVAAAMMVAPQLGAKFGAVPAAVPAFALFALLARGRRPDLRALLGVAILTILAAGLVIAADSLRGDAGSHVGRAIGGGGGEVLGRKAGAAGRLLALSYWLGGLVGCGGSLALLAWRRRSLLGRGLWGRPATRAALVCCAVAAAGSVVANDAGVIAAAWISLLAAASAFSILLVPSDP